MITHASIERRLRKIEMALKAKSSEPPLPEIFFVPKDVEDIEKFERDAYAKCKAMKPERFPLLIHFVGPDGGTEYGTGPFQEDEEEDCNSLWT